MSGKSVNRIENAEDEEAPSVSAKKIKLTDTAAAASCSQKPTGIFVLDEDSLVHLCKFLSIPDQWRFACSCERFKRVFLLGASTLFKTFDINECEELSFDELENMLKLIGPMIQTIKGRGFRDINTPICHLVLQYATHVKRVHLAGYYNMLPSVYERLFSKSITDLSLKYCGISDEFILALKQLPQLTTLSIASSECITGEHLCELTTLTQLNLVHMRIPTEKLVKTFESLKNLTSLSLIDRSGEMGDAFHMISQHCQQLQTLKISFIESMECIGELPNLVHLECCCENNDTLLQLLRALSQHKAKKLKVLKLLSADCGASDFERIAPHIGKLVALVEFHFLMKSMKVPVTKTAWNSICNLKNLQIIGFYNWDRITSSQLFELIKACPQLKLVHIDECKMITADVLYDVMKYCKQVDGISIDFDLYSTNIDKCILMDPMYIASKGKVKVHFRKNEPTFLSTFQSLQ